MEETHMHNPIFTTMPESMDEINNLVARAQDATATPEDIRAMFGMLERENADGNTTAQTVIEQLAMAGITNREPVIIIEPRPSDDGAGDGDGRHRDDTPPEDEDGGGSDDGDEEETGDSRPWYTHGVGRVVSAPFRWLWKLAKLTFASKASGVLLAIAIFVIIGMAVNGNKAPANNVGDGTITIVGLDAARVNQLTGGSLPLDTTDSDALFNAVMGWYNAKTEGNTVYNLDDETFGQYEVQSNNDLLNAITNAYNRGGTNAGLNAENTVYTVTLPDGTERTIKSDQELTALVSEIANSGATSALVLDWGGKQYTITNVGELESFAKEVHNASVQNLISQFGTEDFSALDMSLDEFAKWLAANYLPNQLRN
jgi:hypothetical protein